MTETGHKSGFVSILGNPNVGKSTLMNALVGERLSIVTNKAQTTRHRILGIVDTPAYQIVYSDTPGILTPNYALQEAMLAAVKQTFEDSDLILYITDTIEKFDKNLNVLETIGKLSIPKLVLINKVDLTTQEKLEKLVAHWTQFWSDATVLPISALHKFGLEQILPWILELLPLGEKFFPPDTLTDRPTRFFVTEIIREKILEFCQEEIPYSVEIAIKSYSEAEAMDRIEAVIFVARDSQKGILIGRQGSMLKRIGSAARKEIETFLQKHVYLQLHVQVSDNWRNDAEKLRDFGYIE
jgi:GTP-binding protein era